jgi:5-methylcytosine-specific restriction endonuclease McrA
MKNKYGHTKSCLHCGTEFITKPRFLEYCSQHCKNPINRPGNVAWNKGIKLTEEQKAKQNTDGLKKGRGWNKGIPNEQQRQKWLTDNPNKDGKVNNLRPKNYIDTEFTAYRRACRKATYRTIYAMAKEGLVPATGKRKTDLQLDHIIPYKQGFELNISPEIIGGRKNLRFILGEDNRKKWDRYQPDNVVQSIIGD